MNHASRSRNSRDLSLCLRLSFLNDGNWQQSSLIQLRTAGWLQQTTLMQLAPGEQLVGVYAVPTCYRRH